MAILQLSRITHRKGLAENLPQLAGAELGWAIDERRLFIGNGTIEEGAPVIGNTEILTEFSDILALSSTYTYKGLAAGYQVETGANGEIVSRSLQSKLDEIVSVKDFGAVGDGVTDDTDAINRANYELFCREVNPQVRRSLFFPAGVYRVTQPIKIPPHAKLWGEGLTSSIIKFIPENISVTEMVAGKRYAISDLGTSATFPGAGASPQLNDVFIASGPGTGDGLVREVPDRVVETADSLHQTGANMGTNGAQTPTGIEISSMAIESLEENTLLLLDSVTDSGFYYLSLRGPRTDANDAKSQGYDTSAISIASTVSSAHNLTLSKIKTEGTTYSLRIEGDSKGIVFENSNADYHYKGVEIYAPSVDSTSIINGKEYKILTVGTTDFTAIGAPNNNVGTVFTATGPGTGDGTVLDLSIPSPTGIVISRNIFDNIAQEGIHFHNVLYNSSAFNVFYNVANNLGTVPIAPVIHMETDQCVSIGDLFERVDESIYPRVEFKGNGGIAIDATHSIHLGSYERQVGLEAVLPGGTTDTIFSISENNPYSFKIEYNLIRDSNKTRMGWAYVSNDNVNVVFNEEYTESNDLGVELSAVGTGLTTEIQFTSSPGNDAIINYSVIRLD